MDELLIFILVGFLAQMIDGTLGMAYGVSATSFLLAFGLPPAAASASVHAAEVVTTGVSGISHFRLGNVERHLMWKLAIPGVIGAIAGAWILTSVSPEIIKPIVSGYLLLMGILIILKALRRTLGAELETHLGALGFTGGFLDAMGGGGWGPIVVSTLVARGKNPRLTIGSAILAEFFVAVAASATFILTIGLYYWKAILGLAIGGAIAAPLAALAVKKAPTRPLMILVGVLIILLSVRNLVLAF